MSGIRKGTDPRDYWKWKLPSVELVNNYDFYCNLVKEKYGATSIVNLLKSLFVNINPWFGDGIIVQARLSRT